MKKLLLPLLALSAASLAFAGGDGCKDNNGKCDDKCTKECCSKDAKACADAKDSKAAEGKKDVKPAEAAEKK